LIRQLHQLGIHHHDVFGHTLIDDHGTVRLVDFGQAELVPPDVVCDCCDDRDSLAVLELED
jgi:tRNA A-37 threonylcarbamoyl transferase component Bud32